MRKIFVVIFLVLAVALLAASTVQASPRQDFYLEAHCPSLDYPGACDIVFVSSPFAHLEGGRIVYFDRVNQINPAGHILQNSRVELVTGNGDGMAIGQVRWHTDRGRFTLGQGTGSLSGFHANGKIGILGVAPDGRYIFSLTGTYHVDP